MDVRAADQARRIAATGHRALKYNGYGNVSAEWLPCKTLWLKENEPENYRRAAHVGEFIDWLTHRLTGEWVASINNTSIRWYYDRAEGGWPLDFYEQIGLGDLPARFPQRVLDMGEVAGTLLPEVAEELGLPRRHSGGRGRRGRLRGDDRPERAPAGQAGLHHRFLAPAPGPKRDAAPRQGHLRRLHGCGAARPVHGRRRPGLHRLGGQVVQGQLLRQGGGAGRRTRTDVYTILNELARPIPPGSEGLIVLDYWQGNRTPYVDPEARGIIRGLSLKHTTGHLFRAIIEGIAYGTEHILRTFRQNGYVVDEMVAGGGPTKSPLWMQIHADVSNVPITLTAVPDAPALGSAILGAVAAGLFPNVQSAAANMVQVRGRIEPDARSTRRTSSTWISTSTPTRRCKT